MELIIYTYQLCLSKWSLQKSLVKRDVEKAQTPVVKKKECDLQPGTVALWFQWVW